MSVSLRKSEGAPWVRVGEWFERLVELPNALIEFEENNKIKPKRILLAVPSRSLVANALSWGFSKHAFDNPQAVAESFPVSNLLEVEPGFKLRLVFPVGLGETERQIRVGTLVSCHRDGDFVRAQIETKSITKTWRLIPKVTYSLEDAASPEGNYWEPLDVSVNDKAARRNFFNSQQNPQALIFTEIGAYQEELNFSFAEPSLFEDLGVQSLNFEEAARVDRLSDDRHSHFVNTWENLADIDRVMPEITRLLSAHRIVILDGNLALEALSQHESFRDSRVLGIFETGRNLIQERGAAAFLGEAMYSEPISDFESMLRWKAPDGIKIWGWA
jgi:hypothetical protein